MAIVMIDNDAAEAAQARIKVGDIVTGTRFDGSRFESECVAKGAYSLQLKGKTSGMSIPISLTDAYNEELENMARMQMPAGQLAPAPRRGRPPKGSANAAPVEHPVPVEQPQPVQAVQLPGHGYQPVGASGPKGEPPHQGTGGKPPQMPTQQPGEIIPKSMVLEVIRELLPTDKPQAVTIHKAEGDPDWPRSAIDDMVNDFREKLTILVDSLEQEAEDDARDNVELPPAVKTCGDCFNVDIDKGICTKFQCAPPLFVILDAKAKCPDFTNLDNEIPF